MHHVLLLSVEHARNHTQTCFRLLRWSPTTKTNFLGLSSWPGFVPRRDQPQVHDLVTRSPGRVPVQIQSTNIGYSQARKENKSKIISFRKKQIQKDEKYRYYTPCNYINDSHKIKDVHANQKKLTVKRR